MRSRFNDSKKPQIEVEDTKSGFRFRIVRGTAEGQWAPYGGVARLTYSGQTYYAVTAFYDGTFPIERVFTVKELD